MFFIDKERKSENNRTGRNVDTLLAKAYNIPYVFIFTHYAREE